MFSWVAMAMLSSVTSSLVSDMYIDHFKKYRTLQSFCKPAPSPVCINMHLYFPGKPLCNYTTNINHTKMSSTACSQARVHTAM